MAARTLAIYQAEIILGPLRITASRTGIDGQLVSLCLKDHDGLVEHAFTGFELDMYIEFLKRIQALQSFQGIPAS